jgi:predicted transcriptional regulator of viral defense system
MQGIGGIKSTTRSKLVEVLRKVKPVFTAGEVAEILSIAGPAAAKLLARWVEQGWLIRVRRGSYMAVPPEARSPDEVSENPLIVASRVFDPCYLGGWTAAEQWGLTEQIFRTIVVITTRSVAKRQVTIRSSAFLVRTVSQTRFFGTRSVWRDNFKIAFSDPTKTVVDMLSDPALAGGAGMLSQILDSYISSNEFDAALLLDYSAKMNNGATYKRLGYLLERNGTTDKDLVSKLRSNLTSGNAKLDPSLPCKTLVTRWRLFIPENWGKNRP